MATSPAVTLWNCHPVAEQTCARTLALSWNGFSCATLKSILRAVMIVAAPTWADLRLDTFVTMWACTYETIEIDGVELEFVVCTQSWVQELVDCVADGGCSIAAPDCRSVVGYGHPA